MDYTSDIKKYIDDERDVLQRLDVGKINEALNLLVETKANHGHIYIFGNGGSASTASHFQNDFNKGVSLHLEERFRFRCLNDNIATMMAIANDISYDDIFYLQLENILEPNDIIIAISASGNSVNVIKAAEYAKSLNNKVIGLTGYDGGVLGRLSDIHLNVPINSMQITEDIHMTFDHLMMSVLHKHLCGIEHLTPQEKV
jgi:D-sedoheptulose 7-phosphate isomerase